GSRVPDGDGKHDAGRGPLPGRRHEHRSGTPRDDRHQGHRDHPRRAAADEQGEYRQIRFLGGWGLGAGDWGLGTRDPGSAVRGPRRTEETELVEVRRDYLFRPSHRAPINIAAPGSAIAPAKVRRNEPALIE